MMKGGDIAGLLIRQARLRLNWSQEGLCRGICAPSYLSKIEQGKATPSPEVTELLLRRLGLVWTPEPESLEPCWKALLSGSPDFASCYERLVQPRQEVLACSPLAADALLLDAFYEDNMRPLPEEWEPFLSNRQLALQRQLPVGEKGLPFFRQRAHVILIKGIQQQGVRRQRTAGEDLLPGLHQPLIAGGEVWAAGEQGLPAWFQTLGFRRPDQAQPAQQKLRHLRRRRCLALFDLRQVGGRADAPA